MNSFKKILLAIDDSVDILTDEFEKFIMEIVDDMTCVRVSEDFTIPLDKFKGIVNSITNMKDSEEIYTAIEAEVDNYVDDIHDLIQNGSWESAKVIPTVFIRDRRQDNKFRSKFIANIPVIVQFIANDQNKDDPGMERTDKIFELGVDVVVIATEAKKLNNIFGLQYIGYTANMKKIRMVMYKSTFNRFNFPEGKEELEVFRKIEMNSEEYKNKFTKSVKKMRNTYYNGIKERSAIKIIDDLGPSKRISVTKPKIQTKASKKRQHRKDQIANEPVSQIVEVEIGEESYD